MTSISRALQGIVLAVLLMAPTGGWAEEPAGKLVPRDRPELSVDSSKTTGTDVRAPDDAGDEDDGP